jgi:hypothetical protein
MKTAFPENGISGKFNWLGPPAGELTDNPTFEDLCPSISSIENWISGLVQR